MCTNSLVMPSDMSDLCRVCLKLPETSQYLDLATIYDEDDNLTYSECFTFCTEIDLSAGKGLPHHLCKSCGLELQMAYDFHKKIHESKRVIEQCQKQLKLQELNAELQTDNTQSKNVDLNESGRGSQPRIVNEKIAMPYGDDVPLSSQNQEFVSHACVNVSEEDILNICKTEETNLQQQNSLEKNISEEAVNENKDLVEVEEFQNLEALEEEETETLQIKYGKNIIPVHVTKFKVIESEENDDFVVYAENVNEEIENQEEREELDEEIIQDTIDEDVEYELSWQENVVTVANKEHLPIEIESIEGEGEEQFVHETTNYKNNESPEIVNESSQDEAIEYEEVEEDNDDNAVHQINPNTNKNNNITGRKRHVGSYSCDFCHRVYPNYSRMKTHRRCHEADRPKFSCSHCGRIYATKQARDCHIQTAHDKSGYTCSICNKVFAIRKSLEIHIRYHTGDFPYACNLCDRKFAQACHLNTHINVKHNQIRFSCDYPNCGKFFTSSSSLRNHEYTHGIMPFECEYCQQGYPAKSKLRIHIQRKHGIDMSNDQLERMRKFHVMRSKVNLVQFVDE